MKLLKLINKKQVKILLIILCLFMIIFFGINIFLNQISYYGKNLIKNGELKPLNNLLNIDKNKYDLIISYLLDLFDNPKNSIKGECAGKK